MHEDCEYCVKRNICTRDVPKPCRYRYTEDERKADQASDQCGVILSAMYLPKTYQKEEDKMNATSTETFHDIIAIDFELQTFPSTGEQDKFIVTARNRDDIFAFEFNGPCLVEACRKAGLLTGWEKDQKIRELEKRNKQNKELANAWAKEYYYLSKKIDKLKEENEKLKQLKTATIENFADEEPADNVNHPSHYTGKYECIDVMQDVFGDEATNDFCLCNAFKYIWRARKKNGLEDVKKAVWYLNKYIEEAEKDGQANNITGT